MDFKPNPEDVWSSADHQEAIRMINWFIDAAKNYSEQVQNPIFEQIKTYCKTRKNRQLLILNDFHLYLREAYRSGHKNQQIILEIIYAISQEEDFCDELALLGEMADEVFVFLQTHLKSYNQLNDFTADPAAAASAASTASSQTVITVPATGEKSNPKRVKQQIEIIDSATLLKLDLWIRILTNFCRNQQVLEYLSSEKQDCTKYLLLFLQNIDTVVKKNPNLSSINSLIIAQTVKAGVLEILFLLAQIEQTREIIITTEGFLRVLYFDLLKRTTNASMFSSLCRVLSQVALSPIFPAFLLGVKLCEDFILNSMMFIVFNQGYLDQPPTVIQNWESIHNERQSRANFTAEVSLARAFFRFTLHNETCESLLKSLDAYNDHVILRFALHCHDIASYDSLIYILLALIELAENHMFLIEKGYQKRIILFLCGEYSNSSKPSSTAQKQSGVIAILSAKLLRFLSFASKSETQEAMSLLGAKTQLHVKLPHSIQRPTFDDAKQLHQMRTKKVLTFEKGDRVHVENERNYQVQRLVVTEKPYGESVNYSQLLSEANESDFVDSLDEIDIYHIKPTVPQPRSLNAAQLAAQASNKSKKNLSTQNRTPIAITNNSNTSSNQRRPTTFKFEEELFEKNIQKRKQRESLEQKQLQLKQQQYSISNNQNQMLYPEQQLQQQKYQQFRSPIDSNRNQAAPPGRQNNNPFDNTFGEISDIEPNSNNSLQQSQSQIYNKNNQSDSQDSLAQQLQQQLISPRENNNRFVQQQQQQQQLQQLQQQPRGVPAVISPDVAYQKLYRNESRECFYLHKHFKYGCQECALVLRSTFDGHLPSSRIESLLFALNTGEFNPAYFSSSSVANTAENDNKQNKEEATTAVNPEWIFDAFMCCVHSFSYLLMQNPTEATPVILKPFCLILADQSLIYGFDRRFRVAILVLFQHYLSIHPDSAVPRLMQLNFLSVQDCLLTSFLNGFGYKQFNLLKLTKRGVGSLNNNPIFQQVLRRQSNSNQDDDDNDDDLNDSANSLNNVRNKYRNVVIQSTLILGFDVNSFLASEFVLSEEESAKFIAAAQDRPLKQPRHLESKYTDYYLQLHGIYHVLSLTDRIVKYVLRSRTQAAFIEAAPSYVDAFIDLLAFFHSISTIEEPIFPFYTDMKCWLVVKSLASRSFSKVVSIISRLLTKNKVISAFYANQEKRPQLIEVIQMASTVSSVKESVLLTSLVYYFYRFKQDATLNSKSTQFNAYDLKCFTEELRVFSQISRSFQVSQTLSELFTCDLRTLQRMIRNVNHNTSDQEPTENNGSLITEKSVCLVLRFVITAMQLLCQFAGQQVMKQLTDPEVFVEFFAALSPFVDLCEKLETIYRKKRHDMTEVININGRVITRPIQQQPLITDNNNDTNQVKPYSSNDRLSELANDTQSSILLLLYTLSKFRNLAIPILANPFFQSIVRTPVRILATVEAEFCFASTIHSLSKTMVTLDNIQRDYKTYSKDVTNLLYTSKIKKNNLLPILRSVRFLLTNRFRDAAYFREMIPKLREYSDIYSADERSHNIHGIPNPDFNYVKFKEFKAQLTDISAINTSFNKPNGMPSSGSHQPDLSFIDKKSFLSMLNDSIGGEILPSQKAALEEHAASFLDSDSMSFLDQFNDEQDSAGKSIEDSLNDMRDAKNKNNENNKQQQAKPRELFVKESRLLLKLLGGVSQNELIAKMKELRMLHEQQGAIIKDAGTLSKKTQKQQADLETKKAAREPKLLPPAHSDSELYGHKIQSHYQDRLAWVPDYFKHSSLELYEIRKRQREEEERKRPSAEIYSIKDDSESTIIRIRNGNQGTSVLFDRPVDFLDDRSFAQAQSAQKPNANNNNNNNNRYNNDVESLAKFIKEQQHIHNEAQRMQADRVLPIDSSSISSIGFDMNNNKNSNYKPVTPLDDKSYSWNKQLRMPAGSMVSQSQQNILSKDFTSVLRNTGQNILGDVDQAYKKMYAQKLDFH